MKKTDKILPDLRLEEVAALRIRAKLEQGGYQLYRMGCFEEYDLYMQNKSFLQEDDVITFSGLDGRLMALKPDVTLSIVKNTPQGEMRRLYYNEDVYRRSRQTGEYRSIRQMGVECIGEAGLQAEAEVLRLAIESLAVLGEYRIDLSHMGLIELLLAPFAQTAFYEDALQALRLKSPHEMARAAEQAGVPGETIELLEGVTGLSGDFEETLVQAEAWMIDLPQAAVFLQELESIHAALKALLPNASLRLDFSILNDADYYNGLIFQGFVQDISQPVLFGGRYDQLLMRMGKTQGALGFALSLDEIGRTDRLENSKTVVPRQDDFLNIALPKGRMGEKVYDLFEQVGLGCKEILDKSRKLVFEDAQNKVRYFLVKPSDVDIYVEHGAADIGVVGKDVLLESGADVLELADIKMGSCRLVVAAPEGYREDPALPLRVATKYPNIARRFYNEQSRAIELIRLHGSIELAPLLGLSDVIVDIVETGSTLKENKLRVLSEVVPSSARLIANKVSWRFKGKSIDALLEKLEDKL